MELIDIVDENGNFTGEIVDRKEAHDKNLLHNEIVVFVTNDKDQVLFQKRSSNKRYNPNKWALCAGLVISKETVEEATIREIKEEIGIEVDKDSLIFLDKIKDTNSFINFFSVKINLNEEDFIIQEEELSEVKWFDINNIIDMVNNDDENILLKKERLYLFDKIKNKEQ